MSSYKTCQLSDCPVATALERVFGTPFEFSSHTDAHPCTCDNTHDSADCSCSDGFCVTRITDVTWRLTIQNLETASGLTDATADVEAVDSAAVVRMASLARTLIDKERTIEGLNAELGYFIEQVSGDLEEACWFRRMAESVAACRPDEPLDVLCDEILPQLRNLLYARSVLVLQADEDEDTLILNGIDAEADDNWTELAKDIICHFGAEAGENAVILNADFPGVARNHLPGSVDAFVLVRIGSVTKHYGWLVALGRTDSMGLPGQSRRSESEFGTHEATLMESTAVLLATHAANCGLFAEQEKTLVGVVTAMVNALDARDPYTRGHSHRVAMIGQRLAQEIGLSQDEVEDIYLTGLLHDIGKIGVPDHVLLKNGPLNAEEREQIEQHTVIGHSILKPVKQLARVLPGVLHHHERVDGTGYPGALSGSDIPLSGRILAVADAFDAMTTSRPYRQAMPVVYAVQILLEGALTHWDEVIVDAFFQALPDIHRIYECYEQDAPPEQGSILQYGRLEDISHSRLSDLARLSGES